MSCCSSHALVVADDILEGTEMRGELLGEDYRGAHQSRDTLA